MLVVNRLVLIIAILVAVVHAGVNVEADARLPAMEVVIPPAIIHVPQWVKMVIGND